MPEPDSTPAAPAPAAEPAPVAETPAAEPKQQQTFDAEYVAKLRAENAKYRTTAKENAEKAQRFDELEESSKSELQKAIERAERAEAAAKQAETERIRLQVANEKGVPASLLAGTTAEELAASADALLDFKGTSPPAVDFGAGNRGEASTRPKQLTRSDLARMTNDEIVAADDAGQLADLKSGRSS